jgi:hypothetical protein
LTVLAAVLAVGAVIFWLRSDSAPGPSSAPAPAPVVAAAATVDAGGASAARLDDLPEDPEPEDPPDESPGAAPSKER